MDHAQDEKTIVTGSVPDAGSPCPDCGVVNPISNEYCTGCGAPLGVITEVAEIGSRDTPRRAETWRVYGVETEIVGRQREFESLVDIFREAIDTSSCHLVMLTGPEGIGKSRLVAEFNERLDSLVSAGHLVAGACRETTGSPYAVFSRLVKSRFYIPEQEQGEVGRIKLAEAIKAIIRNPLSTEIAHMVGYLIGLPYPESPVYRAYGNEAERILGRARGALTKLIEKDAERQPLVLVLEDLHAAGSETLELIEYLHEALADSPVILLLVAKPRLRRNAPQLFESGPRRHLIDLMPLADEDVRKMVRNILHRSSGVPRELDNLICERAFGNPMSVEQIIRLLIGSDVIDTRGNQWKIVPENLPDIDLPSTFEGLVRARLTTLQESERRVLELAAVIGRTFWIDALAPLERLELDGDSIDELEQWRGSATEQKLQVALDLLRRKDMIRLHEEDSLLPGQVEYVFKHETERKLLYDSIDPALRERYHALAAQWLDLAARRPEVRRQFIERIAHHFELGHNFVRAGQVYIEAGREAAAHYHNRAAVLNLEKALAFLGERWIEARIDVLHDIGSVLDLMGEAEASLVHFEDLLRSAWLLGHRAKIAVAYNKLGRAHRSLGNYDRALGYLGQGLSIFRELEDLAGIAACLDDIGKVHTIRGTYEEAEEHYAQALEIRKDIDDPRSQAVTLNSLGTVKLNRGNFKDALVLFRQSLELRKSVGDRRGVAESLNSLAVICHERGDLEQASTLYSEVESIAREIGDRVLLGIALNNTGEALLVQGQLEPARKTLTEAVEITRELGERRVLLDALRNLGQLHMRQGNYDEAISLTEESHTLAEALDARVLVGVSLRSLGEMYAATLFDPDKRQLNLVKAEDCFRESIQILKDVGAEGELGRCLSSYGGYLLEQGLLIQGKKRLEMAKEIFARLEMKKILEKTSQTIDEL